MAQSTNSFGSRILITSSEAGPLVRLAGGGGGGGALGATGGTHQIYSQLQILILEEPLDNRRTAIQPRSTIVLRKPSTT
uniref:Cytochrome P450 n=1 Tax=Ditylenchus dipsaci TaxID=166011 RepID=A0A915D4B3_9BILA